MQMQAAHEALARQLAAAWTSGRKIAVPPLDAAPGTRAEAFAIQDRMAEILDDPCVGWKVGAAVPAVQVMDGHDGPITGRLLASRLYTDSALLQADRFSGFKIESEVAFRFKRPVPARVRPYARAELEPLLVFHPGLELAGSRYANVEGGRKPTTRDLIADNGVCGAYVVGAGVEDWQGLDFESLLVEARVDGGEPIQRFHGDYYRDPVDILVETVNGLGERGIGVGSGDLLTTGSLTLPTSIQAGQTYVARFANLAILSLGLQ